MKIPFPTALATTVWAAAAALLGPRASADTIPPIQLETGVIDGAAFAIARPSGDWNHKLFLIAHGYRAESAPLIPDLRPDRLANRTLLDEGWIVATTSFRRNGVVIADAIADLDGLRAYIANAYGDPEEVYLEGDSMGGLIVTLMAERDKGLYQGAVAFDATLYLKETNSTVGLSLLPRIPLLFIATEREVAAPKSYLTSLVSRPDPVVQPELFLIRRDGHTNINQMEHLEGRRAIVAWAENGRQALPKLGENQRYFDATLEVDPGPSTAVVHAGQPGFETQVSEVDPVYGNVLLAAEAKDFEAAAIPPMTYVHVVIGTKSYRALYGRTYTDVKVGNWIAFPDADGHTVLAIYEGSAANSAGLKDGTVVDVRAFAPHEASR